MSYLTSLTLSSYDPITYPPRRRVKRRKPKMLADIITQAELKSVLETYNALGQIILGIRRRIEAGAAVEEGIYTAQSNTGDPISGFDRAMNGIGMFGLDLETKGLPSDVYAEPVTATEPAQEEDREPASKFPEWVGFEPLADYRL